MEVCASTAREENHHGERSSGTTTYVPEAASDQSISTKSTNSPAAEENHNKDSYHSAGCAEYFIWRSWELS